MGLPPSTICKPGGAGGLVLPLLPNEVEDAWPVWLRALLYLVALLYSFCGISVIADTFMEAIDEITSAEKEVVQEGQTDAEGKPLVEKVRVWNDTVANLTLMALGSSAPEIMLNVVEVVGHGYYAGDLGPSTIVGSAAFNFLIIIAVCIVAVPAGEERRIRSFATFVVTTAWSLLAYFWLYLCVSVWTPDVVTVAEALITFAGLPLLVYTGYHADIGTFGLNGDAGGGSADEGGLEAGAHGAAPSPWLHSRRPSHGVVGPAEMHEVEEALHVQMERVRKTHDPQGLLTEQQLVSIAAADMGLTPHTSIATYRIGYGGRRRRRALRRKVKKVATESIAFLFPVSVGAYADPSTKTPKPRAAHKGPREGESVAAYEARRAREKAWAKERERIRREEYLVAQGIGRRKRVGPSLLDKLLERLPGGERRRAKRLQREGFRQRVEAQERARLQQQAQALAPPPARRPTRSGVDEKRGALLPVDAPRSDARAPAPRAPTVTIDGPAEGEGAEPFELGAAWRAQLWDALLPHTEEEEEQEVVDAGGAGSVLGGGATSDGMPDDDDDDQSKSHSLGRRDSSTPTGGGGGGGGGGGRAEAAPGGRAGPGAGAWALHLVFLPWQLLYALSVPPAAWLGGLPTFAVALGHIGLLTALVADVAGILGCVLSIPDPVTAITLVALGTSLPDTFASMIAAKTEPTADASVTNVTGSNSVNVFLGLGLPWLCASLYWGTTADEQAKAAWAARYPEVAARLWDGADLGTLRPQYVVLGGDLGFSVGVFCTVCVVGTMLILYRRFVVGGELGGPPASKWASATFLGSLWVVYTTLAVLRFMGIM